MSTPSPLLRIVWAVLALVQATVTVGAPLADAFHEDGLARVTHVESETGEHCPSQHDHLFCELFRTVGPAGDDVRPARVHADPGAAVAGPVAPSSERAPTFAGLGAPLGSRAPPIG
ncbi:hypothetical protein [Gaopeijia maritima]|uniref:Uncharacterized protein n=1 Tax=Gaopeijia maritima TaxID=3119007 RepID=A0ABU9EAM9_9BACT